MPLSFKITLKSRSLFLAAEVWRGIDFEGFLEGILDSYGLICMRDETVRIGEEKKDNRKLVRVLESMNSVLIVAVEST